MEATDINGNKIKGHAPKFPMREFGYFRDDQIMFLVTHGTGKFSDALLEEFQKQVNNHLESLQGGTIKVVPQSFSFPVVTDQQGGERLAELQRLEDELKKNEQEKYDEKLQELESKLKNKKEEDLTELQKFLLSGSYAPSTYQRKPFLDAFSLLVCNLDGAPDEPLSLLTNILKLRKDLNGEVITIEPPIEIIGTPVVKTEKPEAEIATPKALTEIPEIKTMRIEDVSPNWVMSAASNGSGTGGPGGLPSPFKGKDRNVGDQYKFDIIDKLGDLYSKGARVDVIILDTAPCLHDLVLAPKEWPDNDLIKGLLGGKLTVYPATYEELRRMENASLDRHDYDMSNHGLFAAGIVHSIVPEANIHLIEVLNQFGVGDLVSLAQGLEKAYQQIYKPGSGRRLVVNCSWMLDLPLSEDHCKANDDKDPKKRHPEYDFEESILYFDLKDREQASALWATCNSIFLAGGQVVAAAGNDWDWSKKRKEKKDDDVRTGTSGGTTQEPRDKAPEARYPAGFVSVVGVGALPKNARPNQKGKYAASSYSNLGDKPAGDGIMTLGGEEGETNGVLGLYLGDEFPVEDKSETTSENYKRKIRMVKRKDNDNDDNEKNSWAWWAGTSFATPILTGTIAAMLSVSGPANPGDAPKAVKALYNAKDKAKVPIIEQSGTEATEDVMQVIQGKKSS